MKRNKELRRRGDAYLCLRFIGRLGLSYQLLLCMQALPQAAFADASPILIAQSIVPPAPEAIGGGNPFQGLGRADDPGPSRVNNFINPSSSGNGLYSTGSPSSLSQSSFSSSGSSNGFSDGSTGTQSSFGSSLQSGSGGSQSGSGGSQSGFGSSQSGFGSSQSGFGSSQNAFTSSPNGFGGTQSAFGDTQTGLSTGSSGFGGQQNGTADPNALINSLQSALTPGAAPNLLNSANPQFGAGLNTSQTDGLSATQSTAGFGQPATGFGQPATGFGQPAAGFGQTQINSGPGSASGGGSADSGTASPTATGQASQPGTGVGTGAGVGMGAAAGTGTGTGTGSASGTGSALGIGSALGTGAAMGAATFGQPGSDSGVFNNPAGPSQPGFGKSNSSSEPVSGSTSNFRHSLFDDANKFDTTNSGTQTPPPTHMPTPSMPLPPVQYSTRGTVPGANAIRLKSAIASLRTGNYTESLTLLNKIIVDNPKHAEAYYVRAVVQVFMRNFKDAKADYEAAIRHSTDPALTERAAAGISKLSH